MTETAQTVKELSQMAGEAFNSVLPYLDQLAQKLGQTAQYLWMLQIKQGYILAATLGFRYLITATLVGLLWAWTINKKETLWSNNCYIFFCGFSSVLTIIWCGNLMCDIKLILTLLFNTDYWAIQQLILLMKANVQF